MKNHYSDIQIPSEEVPFEPQNLINCVNKTSEKTLGRCLQNALALGRELHAQNIDCDFIWGGYYTKNLEEHGVPQTIEEAENHPIPCIHFWIEVPTYDMGLLIVETASESQEYKGEPVILSERPTQYMLFPESRRAFEPSFSANDFRL